MFWSRRFKDPVTGDDINLAARVSVFVQSLIRTWLFPIGNTVLSALWWNHPEWFGDTTDLLHWMILYSLLAVLIESIVGIGMRDQGNRDAVILRRLDRAERHNEEMLALILQLVAASQGLDAKASAPTSSG